MSIVHCLGFTFSGHSVVTMAPSAAIWPQFLMERYTWPHLGNGHAVIRPRLILITYRKSYTPFQTRLKSSNLDDLEGH